MVSDFWTPLTEEVNAPLKYSVTMDRFLTFSMSDPNTQSRALHSLKHDGWRGQDAHTHKP